MLVLAQEWDGDSGSLLAKSSELALLPNCGRARPCALPAWTVFTKALPPAPPCRADDDAPLARVAVLLINNADRSATVSARLAALPRLGGCRAGCGVRDLWARADLSAVAAVGAGGGEVVSAYLEPHESRMLLVSGASAPAPGR